MDEEIEKILESIEIDAKETWLSDLRQRARAADADDAKQIVKEMISWRESHFVGHNRFETQPYYYFFEAYAHEILHEHDDAIKCAGRAAFLFRMRNYHWNEAMLHWFISVIERARNREKEACKEMQMATAILEGMANGFQQEGRRADCQACQELLRELYRSISLSKQFEEITVQNDTEQHLYLSTIPFYHYTSAKEVEIQNEENKKNPPSRNHRGISHVWWSLFRLLAKLCLSLARLPQTLQGPQNIDSKSGGIEKAKKVVYEWDEPLHDTFIKIPMVIIDDNWFTIKPVGSRKGSIKLEDGKAYGWVKVHDNAMDLIEPLYKGDYVLFSKQHDAAEDAIVVVAQPNGDGDKEPYYSIRTNRKSPQPSSKIKAPPIPAEDDVQILGVVTAAAKRLTPMVDEGFVDDKLYRLLFKKVNGDHRKVRELFQAEKKRNPFARKSQLLKNAILRWELEH